LLNVYGLSLIKATQLFRPRSEPVKKWCGFGGVGVGEGFSGANPSEVGKVKCGGLPSAVYGWVDGWWGG